MSLMKYVFAAAIFVGAAGVQADTVDVQIIDFDFTPDPTINMGDTIHWIWNASFPHSTTSVAGLSESWDSGVQAEPFTFDHTFAQAGTFDYYCTVHGFDLGNGTAGGMAGTITVVPEPATLGLLALGGLALIRRRR